jgi:hypothetical protein
MIALSLQHNLWHGKGEITNCLKEFEDTKGVVRIRKSKKDRQHNGQMKKDKRTSNDLQTKHTHKSEDRVKRTLLKIGDELRCSGRVSSSYSTSCSRCVKLVTNIVHSYFHVEHKVKCTLTAYLKTLTFDVHKTMFSCFNGKSMSQKKHTRAHHIESPD